MEKIENPGHPDSLRVREATERDIPRLVELNRLCYPLSDEENVVWSATQLRNHMRVFPEGQLVVELEGEVIAGSSALIVNLGRDPLRNHTFAGITDGGYFHNHEINGDTFYGADIYVHPEARSRGAAQAMYEARRRYCKIHNLRRILVGGRLHNYCDHADRLSPEEYVQRVEKGEIHDSVLHFHLRQGLALRGILRHFLRDPRSRNHAALLEWLNPDFTLEEKERAKVRVACVQYQVRRVSDFETFANQVEYFTDTAAEYGSDFVVFPEFFSVQLLSHLDVIAPLEGIRRLTSFTAPFIELMSGLSRKHGLHIIAGSHPTEDGDRLLNSSFLFKPDGSHVTQPKLHITPSERKFWGISGGDELILVQTPKAKVGILICYDIQFPEATRYLADQGAEIIFVPYCTDNRQGHLRVSYCAQARAIENQIYVVTAGIIGNLPSVPAMDIHYGQASVYTPSDFAFARDGIQAQADSNVETLLVTDLDIDDLYRSRSEGSVTPRLDRRRDLFEIRTKLRNHPVGDDVEQATPLDLPR